MKFALLVFAFLALFALPVAAQVWPHDEQIMAWGPLQIVTANKGTVTMPSINTGVDGTKKCNGVFVWARKPFRVRTIHTNSATDDDNIEQTGGYVSMLCDTTRGNRGATGAAGNYGIEFPCEFFLKDFQLASLIFPVVATSDTLFVKPFFWKR